MSSKGHVAYRGITSEMRRHLEHEVEHLAHVLPGQGPIETFVHHNTLHGFQHLHFDQALAEAGRITGGRGYLPIEEFRRLFATGRVTDGDLEQSLRERRELAEEEPLARAGERIVTAREVQRIALCQPIDPLEAAETPEQRLGPDALRALGRGVSPQARERLLKAARRELDAALARVGKDLTVADLLGEILDLDVSGAVLAEVHAHHHHDGPVDEESIAWSLRSLGVPAAAQKGYLELVSKKLAHGPAPRRADLWLEAETRKVERIVRSYFGRPGKLDEIERRARESTEHLAVLSLFRASLASFGLQDPFSPLRAENLVQEDLEGARIEALFERIEHLEAWGGPAIPLDAALHERVEDEVRAHLEPDSELGAHEGVAKTEIARLCLTIVHDLGGDHLRRRGFEALRALLSIDDVPDGVELLAALTARDPRGQMLAHAERLREEQIGRLGAELSHRDVILALTGEDIHEEVHPQLIRATSAFLDEGLAAWHVAGRSLGFYDAWRKMAESDRWFDLQDLRGARETLRQMPPIAADAVIQCLFKLGVPEEHWGAYLRRLCVALPGFAGMVHWRETHPAYAAQRAHPIDLVQFLAVRLFYETLLVRRACQRAFGHDGSVESLHHYFKTHLPELVVRQALHAGRLPDFLAERARALLPLPGDESGEGGEPMLRLADMVFYYKKSAELLEGGHTARRSAFRLFLLAQHLGLTAGELRAMSLADKERLLGALDGLPPSVMAPIWQAAYEIHYRDEVLHGLAENARRPWKRLQGRPAAQLIFCIDDREEAIRRHIEELRSDYETFGVAGFFGVAIDFQGLGCREAVPLCPIVATPAHRLTEAPRPHAQERWEVRDRRTRIERTARDVLRETLRNPVSSYFLIDLVGMLSLVPVLGRVLFPRAYERMTRRTHAVVVPEIATEVPALLDTPVEPAGDPPRKPGFTLNEQADRVAGTLRNIGLTKNFAPLVLLLGHGSESRNNPHLSAYDCGACGGKHGGPNARVFAAMANRPEVRALLRARGIDIPDDTRFIGSEHNTCTDVITYLDLEDVPAAKQSELRSLMSVLEVASTRSAHERCRKFASAPERPSPERALVHVQNRAADISQARPELGHVTNAFAIVGPRDISEGCFLDRRSFLISYDPHQDPEGKVLEGILLAVGPVGAGINLEYYFSTVDNAVYGCGTKLPHNVSGLVGVMEGGASDLRTGLPKQMIEIHEPMRLVLLVQAKTEILGQIYERQASIRELVGNAWIQLVAMDPDTEQFSVFLSGQGFVPWNERGGELTTVKASADWYVGTMDFLPPALIRPTEPKGDKSPAPPRRAKKQKKVAHV